MSTQPQKGIKTEANPWPWFGKINQYSRIKMTPPGSLPVLVVMFCIMSFFSPNVCAYTDVRCRVKQCVQCIKLLCGTMAQCLLTSLLRKEHFCTSYNLYLQKSKGSWVSTSPNFSPFLSLSLSLLSCLSFFLSFSLSLSCLVLSFFFFSLSHYSTGLALWSNPIAPSFWRQGNSKREKFIFCEIWAELFFKK